MRDLPYRLALMVCAAMAASALATEPQVIGGEGRNCNEDPQCINRLHPLIPMTANADPGETLIMRARNSGDIDLDPNSTYVDPRRGGHTGHALAGPVHINGALAGDTLAIEIFDVQPGPWGATYVSGGGFLADRYPTGFVATWKLGADYATSEQIPGVRIPNTSFPGVITTLPDQALIDRALAREAHIDRVGMRVFLPEPTNAAPAEICGPEGSHRDECLRTIPPREHGGNMDIRYMRPGVTVYLPCLIDGCGLAVGDVHYAQGDGEVSGTAIEIDATVVLSTKILKKAPGPGITYEGPSSVLAIPSESFFATTGIPIKSAVEVPPDMDYLESKVIGDMENLPDDIALAARNALIAMIDYLVEERGYTEEQAYAICSVAVDLRIGQLVDAPNVGATAILPLDIFTGSTPANP